MEKRTLKMGLFVLLVLGMLVLSGCQQNAPAEDKKTDANVKEIVMESYTNVVDGKYFPKFSPDEITVNKGDKVRIKITTTSGNHDFNIDEFGIKAETPLNQEVVVEFIADKAGEFIYYCSKPGHRAAGHWGTLKVIG